MQAEIDRLNTTYVQLVDEHNAKQKHIDVSIEVELGSLKGERPN